MKKFHLTLTQGRSDSLCIESSSKDKVLNFFKTVSTAIVSNIKEILYSKDLNINYTPTTFIPTDFYQKIEVFCATSQNARVYTLYNVKKSVTLQQLKKDLRKLYIDGQEIIEIYNVLVYEHTEGVARLNSNLYQFVYKFNSKTNYVDLEAKNWRTAKEFFDKTINGELYEIRKYVHRDDTVKKDDKNYVNYVRVKLYADINSLSFKIPKLKKNLSDEVLERNLKDVVTIDGKTPKKASLNYSF